MPWQDSLFPCSDTEQHLLESLKQSAPLILAQRASQSQRGMDSVKLFKFTADLNKAKKEKGEKN